MISFKTKNMKTNKPIPESVDEYISDFPEEIKVILEKVRATIKNVAPDAEECISYMMPAYKQNGIIAYFAGQKKHLGFYATPNGNTEFKSELSKYKTGKGSIQFPYDEEIPYELIADMVEFNLAKNLQKPSKKTKTKA